MRKQITEEMGIHKEWMKEAKEMTPEKFPEFMRKLTEDYSHDYGTICHAIAAAAIAAAYSVNRGSEGGISGFQAGAIMWEIIKGWGVFGEGPKKMLTYDEMLYPQYYGKFRSVPAHVWDWLKEEAQKKLKEDGGRHGTETVRAHWESIANGTVPFGYYIENER